MNILSYILWNPSLEAFSIGSFSFRWYSLCWLIGLALAYFVVKRLYKEQKIKDELFDPLFIYCFLGILDRCSSGALHLLPARLLPHVVQGLHRDAAAHPFHAGRRLEVDRLRGTSLPRWYGRPDAGSMALHQTHEAEHLDGARQHRHRHRYHRLLHPLGQPHEL